jgi:hypothetical protein
MLITPGKTMANTPPKKRTKLKPAPVFHPGVPAGQLRQEYEAQQALLQEQSPLVQRFLDTQAQRVAQDLVDHLPQLRFQLPDRVVANNKTLAVSPDFRDQLVGGLMDRLARTDLRVVLRARLLELEASDNQAISTAVRLVRHATVLHMIYNMLPAGRSVTYVAAKGEEIPTIPAGDEMEPESAITASTDAIAEEKQKEAGRGELLVPYVPYARRFYLPQWVAFDEDGKLLVGSVSEAEANVASMQRFVSLLHMAAYLAHYIVADEEYQRKRYGMLGQLVNQGRALARYETGEIIRTIKRRASNNELNRGLSLSLPYFDDQDLQVKLYDFEIIPAGRIMFVPAFVVRAARQEQAVVAQDTRLSPSTRKHLLVELSALEHAFESSR